MNIDVNGTIISNDEAWIYEFFGIDVTSPKKVADLLKQANGEDVEVSINSPGGDLYAGAEIYYALKSYAGNVVTKITAVAASAASIVAMAGSRVLMSPVAQIMIHNTSMGSYGDHKEKSHDAEVLKSHDVGIANAYLLKTGMEHKELLKLMGNETYINATEALKYGFIDEIMFDTGLKLAAANNATMLPQQIINKMREMLAKDNKIQITNSIEAEANLPAEPENVPEDVPEDVPEEAPEVPEDVPPIDDNRAVSEPEPVSIAYNRLRRKLYT